MTNTITNKKGVVDFLWEWAEDNGDWSKLLVKTIVSTEQQLSESERENIFNYFLQSLQLHKGLPPLNIVKPTYKPSNQKIELTSLSGVTGVNRLAQNQTITFGKNLTVVFGENGTGKTGYGRILKTLGFSYDTNNTILSNIYGTVQPKTAIIHFKTNGVDSVFNWDGTNKSPELGNISIFNNSCVQISLSDRELIVSPMGFHLFSLVTTELIELSKLLNVKKNTYSLIPLWKDRLTVGTPQQIFISRLSDKFSEQELVKLSGFTSSDDLILTNKTNELANLHKPLLETEINTLNLSINELKTLIGKIQFAEINFTQKDWLRLKELNMQEKKIKDRAKIGIKEIAESNGVRFYQTKEFEVFIKSAEEYIKILDNEEYPNNDTDTCVYCNQPIDKSAKELLTNYRILLNDKSQETLGLLLNEKIELISKVSKVEEDLVFHQSTYGIDSENNPIQYHEITQYNEKLRLLKKEFIDGEISEGLIFELDYSKYLEILKDKVVEKELLKKSKSDLLASLTVSERTLKSQIAELEDRKFLSTKVEDIKALIANHKAMDVLNANTSLFNTATISRRTTQARDELIASNFENIFQKELKSFRKSHIKIDLNFGTNKGQSKVIHKIKAQNLIDILSEGEQKAIALAEFLTELQLDNIKAPVIFDDPVNSLDHFIIDDVAKRLLELSKDRQIVIFTHSILLFNSFLSISKLDTNKSLDCKFLNSKNEYDKTGYIIDGEEKINHVNTYTKKIVKLIKNPSEDRSEKDIAMEGYGLLRSAIELLVEHHIFQGTVKRYQKNVALSLFLKVNGNLVDLHKEKLNDIFERCCGFISGHSNPEIIYNNPTILELNADFEDFTSIKEIFVP